MSPLSWLGYGASFALVISLIFLMRFVVRYLEPKLRRGGVTTNLKVVETLPLDPKRRLIIFACSERRGLLLAGINGDVFIGWLDDGRADSTPVSTHQNLTAGSYNNFVAEHS